MMKVTYSIRFDFKNTKAEMVALRKMVNTKSELAHLRGIKNLFTKSHLGDLVDKVDLAEIHTHNVSYAEYCVRATYKDGTTYRHEEFFRLSDGKTYPIYTDDIACTDGQDADYQAEAVLYELELPIYTRKMVNGKTYYDWRHEDDYAVL